MARLPLVIYPDEILTTLSKDVLEINQDIVDFAEAMRETMYASHGIGLAAPQVARNIRMMTVDVEPEKNGESFMTLINPVISESHGKTWYEEGCLSFPGLSVDVRRKKSIYIQAYDLQGKPLQFEADGLLAICLQHELDHLNGVTFVDRLSPVQKRLVVRDYLKMREADEEDAQYEEILRVHQKSNEELKEDGASAVLNLRQ